MYGLNNGIPVGLRAVPSFGIARQNQLTAIIQSLFWDGSQGWWYDNDDPSTMYETASLSTLGALSSITAVETSVGLQLDKSKGLARGPELITNGDFSQGSIGWTAPTNNAVITGGALVFDGVTSIPNDTVITTNTTTASIVAGKIYEVKFDIINPTTNPITITVGGASFAGSVNAGSYSRLLLSTNTDAPSIRTRLASGVRTGSVTNISIREVLGNHRYATASGNRPVWSKRVNLLTNTGFIGAVAGSPGTAPTSWSFVASTGSISNVDADKLTFTANGERIVLGQTLTYTVNTTYRATFVVHQNIGINASQMFSWNQAISGAVETFFANGALQNASTYFPVAGDVLSYQLAIAATAGSSTIRLGVGTVTNRTGQITISQPDIRPLNQATGLIPLYQRVNTSTDYDTNGFPGYLKADGTDDFLVTNSIDFSAGPTNPPLGPELVVNGDFSNGTTGWTAANASLSVVGGVLRMTVNNTGTYLTEITSQIPTVAGKTYVLSGVISGVSGKPVVRLTAASSAYATLANTQPVSSSVFTPVRAVFTAVGSTTRIAVTLLSAGSLGDIYEASNISVKEITDANLGADKVTLCAGLRKLSDAFRGLVIELGNGATNTNQFQLNAPLTDATNSYGFQSLGTVSTAPANATGYVAPITNVVTGIGEIATDTKIIRVNGVQAASSTTDQGTGNYGNFPVYFFRRGGTTLPFNGYEYGNICVGKLLTADQLAALETYMNEKTRAY